MLRTRSQRVLLAAVVGLTGVAGCGGDGNGDAMDGADGRAPRRTTTAATPALDRAAIEDALEGMIRRRGVRVRCPEAVAEARGRPVACTARGPGFAGPLAVTGVRGKRFRFKGTFTGSELERVGAKRLRMSGTITVGGPSRVKSTIDYG